MPKTQITSVDDLIKSYRSALQILGNLRTYQRAWEETGGVPIKESKKSWEGHADMFLKQLGGQPEIKISE